MATSKSSRNYKYKAKASKHLKDGSSSSNAYGLGDANAAIHLKYTAGSTASIQEESKILCNSIDVSKNKKQDMSIKSSWINSIASHERGERGPQGFKTVYDS
jgi:hypothetical protein